MFGWLKKLFGQGAADPPAPIATTAPTPAPSAPPPKAPTPPGGMQVMSVTGEQLQQNAEAMGEMYFDCPHCGHCERLNDVGKMIYKNNPFQFKDFKCIKCAKPFDAAPRMKFGACPTGPAATAAKSAPPQATFKKKWSRPNQFGLTDTYEEWTAASEEAAKAYLNTRTITQAQYYVVVETPQGCWGKDCAGIYKE